jgi:hypothetical protein
VYVAEDETHNLAFHFNFSFIIDWVMIPKTMLINVMKTGGLLASDFTGKTSSQSFPIKVLS